MTLPMPDGLEIEIEIPANAPNDHHIPVTRESPASAMPACGTGSTFADGPEHPTRQPS